MPGRVRVGIMAPVLGIPSEVWIERQCAFFDRIEPVLIGWERDPSWQNKRGLETHIVPGSFEPPRTFGRRVLRRLGLARALKITPEQRENQARTLAEARVDGLLTHFSWTAMAASQALPEDMPLIWHVHGRDVSSLMQDRAYQAMFARAIRRADCLVAVGRHQLEKLDPLGLPERSVVIPCGVVLEIFASGAMPAQADGGPLRFISVGRMAPEKGMLENLRAFELIAGDFPTAELVLIGAGEEYETVRAAAEGSRFAARIQLAGRLNGPEIARALSASQIYLQHSLPKGGAVEGFGVTLAEAGAAGLPLLASNIGGLKDQVADGQNGYLFPPGDIVEQARLMRLLAQDCALRARLGQKARQIALGYDAKHMSARLEQEILEAISRRRRKAI